MVEQDGNTLVISVPMEFKRRGGRKEIVVSGGAEPDEGREPSSLAVAVARAFYWQEQLDAAVYASTTDLADKMGIDRSYVGRILKLAGLAPRLVEAILRGEEPGGLSVDGLAKDLPVGWSELRGSGNRNTVVTS